MTEREKIDRYRKRRDEVDDEELKRLGLTPEELNNGKFLFEFAGERKYEFQEFMIRHIGRHMRR